MANRSDDAFSEVTTGRPLSFHELSVGEALAPVPQERENSGGGKFPSQISHRKYPRTAGSTTRREVRNVRKGIITKM